MIPNLIDLSQFETLPGAQLAQDRWPALKGEGPHLLFLSRIHVKKGIEHLLTAMPRLVAQHPDLQLFIAGSGDDAYTAAMQQLAAERGVDQCTHFVGHVGGPDKVSLYEACDLFVLPTSQENFGFVQFEALACNTPVMTTTLVDTHQEVVRSGGGVAVDQSADAIVDGIGPLLKDRDQLAAMGRQGRSWVFEHMSVDRIAGELEAMYRDAIAG